VGLLVSSSKPQSGGPGYPFLWVITFDLSIMGGPANSNATATTALRII
jgi:hypothetical protein